MQAKLGLTSISMPSGRGSCKASRRTRACTHRGGRGPLQLPDARRAATAPSRISAAQNVSRFGNRCQGYPSNAKGVTEETWPIRSDRLPSSIASTSGSRCAARQPRVNDDSSGNGSPSVRPHQHLHVIAARRQARRHLLASAPVADQRRQDVGDHAAPGADPARAPSAPDKTPAASPAPGAPPPRCGAPHAFAGRGTACRSRSQHRPAAGDLDQQVVAHDGPRRAVRLRARGPRATANSSRTTASLRRSSDRRPCNLRHFSVSSGVARAVRSQPRELLLRPRRAARGAASRSLSLRCSREQKEMRTSSKA